jgi:hypothetical protein
MKTCKKCNRTLPDDQFYPKSAWCKECKRDYARKYREQHPGEYKEYQRQYREQLKENTESQTITGFHEVDEEGLIKCEQCGKFKTSDAFYKTYGIYIRMPCKDCMKQNRQIDQEEV